MSPFSRPSIDRALCSTASTQTSQAALRLQARIKKLLDLDRTLAAESTRGAPRVFTDHTGLKQGIDASYTHFNAFCLALGLELLAAGFKQSEVVMWLRLTRPWIEDEYESILLGHLRGSRKADTELPLPGPRQRLYMCVEHLISPDDLTELQRPGKRSKAAETPLAIVPKFFEGSAAFAAVLDRAPSDIRRWLIIECRMLAVKLHNALIAASR